MKKSRFLSFLAAAALAVTTLGATGMAAFAADGDLIVKDDTATHTVTIAKPERDQLDHTYEAYQIFKGTLTGKDADSAVMTYIGWGEGVEKTKLALAVSGNATVSAALATYNDSQTDDEDKITAYSSDKDAAKFADFISANANVPGFAEAIADVFSKALSTTKATATKDENYQFTGLKTGYYLFKDEDKEGGLTPASDGSTQGAYTDFILKPVFLEVTENEVLNVSAKSDVPTIDKNIKKTTGEGESATTTYTKADTASIGDVIEYQLDSVVPNMDGYNKYFFIAGDKMCDGLTFNNDVKVTVGTKDLKEGKDKDYYVNQPGRDGKTFDVVLTNFIQYRDLTYLEDTAGTYYKLKSGEYTTIAPTSATTDQYDNTTTKYKKNPNPVPITITYSATLNEDCDRTLTGNDNNVDLTFSNNPNYNYQGKPDSPDEPDSNEPTGITPEVQTKVFTTGIKVIKVDEKGNPLSGATFKLSGVAHKAIVTVEWKFTEASSGEYYQLKNGTYTKTAPTDDTKKLYVLNESNEPITYIQSEDTSVTTVVMEGSEITAKVDKDGFLVFSGLGDGTYTLEETEAPAGYNKDDTKYTITISSDPKANSSGVLEPNWSVTGADDLKAEEGGTYLVASKTIENKKGIILPSTGGIGTVIFYVVGSLLIGGAAVLFVTKRKNSVKEK